MGSDKSLFNQVTCLEDWNGEGDKPASVASDVREDYDLAPIIGQCGERYFRLRRHRIAAIVCRLKRLVRNLLPRNIDPRPR